MVIHSARHAPVFTADMRLGMNSECISGNKSPARRCTHLCKAELLKERIIVLSVASDG